jgi:LPS sulfotransferase NodH
MTKIPRERKRRPVFVMGCHRSGTNLLYDTLLSAGGFAIYRGYLPVYEILIPHFGPPNDPHRREKLVAAWLHTKSFERTGLKAEEISSKLLSECHTGGDFIHIVMDEIANIGGAQRWALYDPDSVLHVAQIKREIPDALFVHIVRDGRDIALSLMKMGGFRPFPWNRQQRNLLETALYWDWMVHNGRRSGRQFPADYIEIHYEKLVTEPRAVMAKLGEFIDHDLDYDRIQETGLGSLSASNSSFRGDEKETRNPVSRWKERLTHQEIASLESVIGESLEEFGYPLTGEDRRRTSFREQSLSLIYPGFLSLKQWLKLNTPFGRLASLSALEIDE